MQLMSELVTVLSWLLQLLCLLSEASAADFTWNQVELFCSTFEKSFSRRKNVGIFEIL